MSGPPPAGAHGAGRRAPPRWCAAGRRRRGHEDIDLDDLVDVPPEHVVTPIERLTQAFPGSQLMDERH